MDADIIRMAREAGCEIRNGHIYHPFSLDQMLKRFAALVRADERERIKAEPAQEPVPFENRSRSSPEIVRYWRDQRIELEYAYTAPPQSKPLTEEETDRLMQSIGLRHQPPAAVADRLARHGIPMPGDEK